MPKTGRGGVKPKQKCRGIQRGGGRRKEFWSVKMTAKGKTDFYSLEERRGLAWKEGTINLKKNIG